MALGITVKMNDGENPNFLPIIKYLSEAGRFYCIDRVGGSNGFENMPTELPIGTRMIFDFGGICVGWLHFAALQPPSMVLVPVGQALPPPPDKNHRQGFRMLVMTQDKTVREFASTAKTILGMLDDLHGKFEAAPEAAKGKIPVVTFAGTTPLKRNYKDPVSGATGSKTTFEPTFTITNWVDRPAAFGPRLVPPPTRPVVVSMGESSKGMMGVTTGPQKPAVAPVTATAKPQASEPPPNDDDWEMPSPGGVPLPAGDLDSDISF